MNTLNTQTFARNPLPRLQSNWSPRQAVSPTSIESPQSKAPEDSFYSAAPGLPKTLELSPTPKVSGSFALANSKTGTITCRAPGQLLGRAERLRRNGTTLIAVRHGESHSNKAAILSGSEDTPLNEKGRNQAQDAAKAILATNDFHPEDLVIFTSPLSRAKDTALELKKLVPQAPVHIAPELAEIDFGLCEGLPISEVAGTYPNFASGHDFAHRFPQGESGLDVMTRVDRFLTDIEHNYPDKTVVYFGHSMTVAMGRLLLGQSTVGEDGEVVFDKKTPNAVPEVLVRTEKPDEELGLLLSR